ncbi:RNase adapter RapZ [Streptobacillus felis]|uniref:RNase adapter RapZ n=1 Tax=Streptobacillus felis TaxID=1384509 RepID=A0A7Z0TAD2_9FUSO|nr:RNase adapter RapZ [Streptobacillus felis]NYV27890.1 RNase adapter RapZ [Streptobacillus felis]
MDNNILILGLSGSGKTTALKYLEDNGYYVSLNYPINHVLEIEDNSKKAISISIKSDDEIDVLEKIIISKKFIVIFLDASNEELVKRYELLRRTHPFLNDVDLNKAINAERDFLLPLKKYDINIIDTTRLKHKMLFEIIENTIFLKKKILISSFGYKFGIPQDANYVFDVRFLDNPYYLEELRDKTGNDESVYNYVMSFEDSNKLYDKVNDFFEFVLPIYFKNTKNSIHIAIGCTGGRHRSVTLVNKLHDVLKYKYDVFKIHREIDND